MPIFPVPKAVTGHEPVISNSYSGASHHPGVDIVFKDAAVAPSYSAPFWIGGPWFVPPNTPAVAWDGGKVTVAKWLSGGYGVRIRHPQHNVDSLYIHLSSLAVSEGDTVSAGQIVGIIGDSPKGTDVAHLHFEIRTPGDVVTDPTPYLDGSPIIKVAAFGIGGILLIGGGAFLLWKLLKK